VPTASILQYLRRVVGPVDADASLLARFVRQRDEAAFAEIVQRHGPMVWGVCSRALPRIHDAEDAYQATFLVLARKAASISRPNLLANWLFGVARRTSLEARKRRARLREEPPVDVAAPEPASTDLKDALDEEIGRLPDRFRVPIVLSYLEGRSNAEAAHIMGCPEGTVASRLSTAREKLRVRLARRGLAPAVLISLASAEAAPPLAAGIATSILAEGVLKAMFLQKLKIAAIVLVCVGTVGLVWVHATTPPLAAPASAPVAAVGDVPMKDLPTKRRDVAQEEFELRRKAFADGSIADATDMPAGGHSGSSPVVLGHQVKDLIATIERSKLLEASQRLLRAEVDLASDGAGRRAAYAAQIERMTSIERIIRERVRAGALPHVAELEIESIRLEAEARARQE
jgi:RNA polymerase sigma factor (sigma-70 family)